MNVNYAAFIFNNENKKKKIKIQKKKSIKINKIFYFSLNI